MYLVLCDGYFTDYCDYGNVLRASVVQQISVFYNFTGKDTEKEKRTKNTAPFQPEKLSASVHTAWEDAAKKTKAKGYYLSIPQDSTETISLFCILHTGSFTTFRISVMIAIQEQHCQETQPMHSHLKRLTLQPR